MKEGLGKLANTLLALCASVMLPLSALAAWAGGDPLADGFRNPPEVARPQTWWRWMNGNISREGIRLDLQAMKTIGLGGATIFNVDCGIPARKNFPSPPAGESLECDKSSKAALDVHSDICFVSNRGRRFTDDSLLESGLIGPVYLRSAEILKAKRP